MKIQVINSASLISMSYYTALLKELTSHKSLEIQTN